LLVNFNPSDEITPLPVTHVLHVPNLFFFDQDVYAHQRNTDYSTFGKIKFKENISTLDILSWSRSSNVYTYMKYNSTLEKEVISTGNWRLFVDVMDILQGMERLDIIYDICQYHQLLNKYPKTVNKLYLYSQVNPAYRILKDKIASFNEEKFNQDLTNELNKNLIECDTIINGKLGLDLDNKSWLNEIFKNDNSILPLSVNIGQVKQLFSDEELCNLNKLTKTNSERVINLIIAKIMKKIQSLCTETNYTNKYFIIKDANGSKGLGISGFNCFNYDIRNNFQSKNNFIRLIFGINRMSYWEPEKIIGKMLNTFLLVQEFISSPILNLGSFGQFKFKSRIYVLLEQNPDLTINFHLHKDFNLDYMPNFNMKNFFDVQVDSEQEAISHSAIYISNLSASHRSIARIPKAYTYSDSITSHGPADFDYKTNMKDFIKTFARHFALFFKDRMSLFTDLVKNQLSKRIYKVLVIDVIFDSNNQNNIKIVEINTAGAIYEQNFIDDMNNYILTGNIKNFYSVLATNPTNVIEKKYLNKITKYEIKYN
jgi:hypothetical protein